MSTKNILQETVPRVVIEGIKAEIAEKARKKASWIRSDCIRQSEGLFEALDIINKHLENM